jgi:hypothetical protein
MERDTDDTDEESDVAAARRSMDRRAQYVEVRIQQAMRNGDFDDLPGAGKPIENLGEVHDPDWWIRRKIQRENITGLGPPALTLRTEDAAMDARLDAIVSEREVRETLDDFNRRVIEARRQLLGGPPVVTALRDVDAEVERWRERRRARRAQETEGAARASDRAKRLHALRQPFARRRQQ